MALPPDRDLQTREFSFTEQDFQRISKLIYAHAGINLSDSKMDMVYSRLGRRLRTTGLTSFREYLALLESNNEQEWEAFVNALTSRITSPSSRSTSPASALGVPSKSGATLPPQGKSHIPSR